MNEALAVTAHEHFSVSCLQGNSGLLHVFNTAGQTISDLKNYFCLNSGNCAVLLKINFPHFINICL